VALGLLAFDLAGAQAGRVLGTALAIKMVAYVFVAPTASVVMAKVSPRHAMVFSDLLRAVVAYGLPFVTQVWQVYVLVFLLQAAAAVFTPTFQAVIPRVLPEEDDYTQALSLSRVATNLESVLSPVLAAALLLVVSSSTLFFGTALGFVASAVLVISVVLPRSLATAFEAEESFISRVGHGIKLFIAKPTLRPVLAINLAVAAAGAFVIVQTVVIVRTVFAQTESMVAVLLAVNGVGSMCAAVFLPRIFRRHSERAIMLNGAVMLSAATAVIPLAIAIGPAMLGLVGVGVLWLLIGAGWAMAETPIGRLVRRSVETAELPAAFAAQFSLSHVCWLVTYPIAGWLGSHDLSITAILLASIAAGATITAAFLFRLTTPSEE